MQSNHQIGYGFHPANTMLSVACDTTHHPPSSFGPNSWATLPWIGALDNILMVYRMMTLSIYVRVRVLEAFIKDPVEKIPGIVQLGPPLVFLLH